jgi:hypothetical protein
VRAATTASPGASARGQGESKSLRAPRSVGHRAFVGGLIAKLAFGGWLTSAGDVRNAVIGVIIIAIGLNYAPLAVCAIRFSATGALEAEPSDADVPKDLRRYTVLQLWVFVPLALVILDVRHRLRTA